MKMLLSTTALVLALGFPTMALSQAATPAAEQTKTQQSATKSGFLAKRGQSDVLASRLMGHDVYAARTSADMTKSDEKADKNADRSADMTKSDGMATMNRADLENMDNIGQINEIVLSKDGEVRALVIGVGGFLGMGEHDVAVTMDEVTFASDADDRSEMYIIVNTSTDMLKDAPPYDRTMTTDATRGNPESRADSGERSDDRTTTTDAASGNAETHDERAGLTAPAIEREGYNRVKAEEVSAEMLMGQTVYDGNDEDVGDVTNLIIDDAGKITEVVIDFGGFLGIGKSQVSIAYDQLAVMSTEGYSDVRVYVDASKEQIQSMPKYQPKK